MPPLHILCLFWLNLLWKVCLVRVDGLEGNFIMPSVYQELVAGFPCDYAEAHKPPVVLVIVNSRAHENN